jgi:general secretion pathway protein I
MRSRRTVPESVPQGRQSIAQGASPGKAGPIHMIEPRRGGRNIKGRQRLCRPSGARRSASQPCPGLTPWAMNYRPFGTIARGGFSLLEVILALAILTGAVAVLGELARMGMESARSARYTARAQLLCESKMNQIAAGWASAQSTSPTQFSDDEVAADSSEPLWMYAVDVQQTQEQGVVAVCVTVTQDPPGRPKIEVSITRWMVDKTVEQTMASDAEAAMQSSSGS